MIQFRLCFKRNGWCFAIFLTLVAMTSVMAQTETILGSIDSDHPDGPYIFYTDEGVKVISVSEIGTVTQKLFPGEVIPAGTLFEVISDANDPTTGTRSHFNVTLQSLRRRPGLTSSPDSLIVLSDVHAKWAPFVSILKVQGIIDNSLKWAYGTNQLMIIGDICDRGVDAITCYWLIYELQREARLAGGEVYLNLGNHEDMRIKGSGISDYVDIKYQSLASFLATKSGFDSSYKTFGNKYFNANTEMGRFLRDATQTIQIIGSDMYVHGGISESVFGLKMSVDSINTAVASQIAATARTGVVAKLLDSSNGLLWYRGMVPGRDEKFTYKGVLAPILRHYGVERVFVGHTEVQSHSSGETEWSLDSPLAYAEYDYRVVNVNVQTANAMAGAHGRGALVMKNGSTYSVYDTRPNTAVPLPTAPIPDHASIASIASRADLLLTLLFLFVISL